jgi:arabinogalactan oligomer/maltooligosaccharide transport system permease protein
LLPFAFKAFRKRWWLIFPWALILQILFVLPGALSQGIAATASLGELFPLSFYAVLIANIWLGWPFMMAIATGALQGIPGELYEAATVDGASKWQAFWSITVPLLRPAMIPAIIIGMMWTFNNFNVMYFITGGGPLHQTEILVTQAYRFVNETTVNLGPAIGNVRPYGVAAAFAYVVFAILATITLITNRVSRATEAYYA